MKTVFDLISPAGGRVIRVNSAVEDQPERINIQPEEAWLIEAAADTLSENLMDEDAYANYVESLA